jgi:hypothetical protein
VPAVDSAADAAVVVAALVADAAAVVVAVAADSAVVVAAVAAVATVTNIHLKTKLGSGSFLLLPF